MSDHALLSASGAHRWANCPGSVQAEKPYPDTTSVYAARGTLAHEIAEDCLTHGEDAASTMGREGVDQELVDGVQFYLDYVRNTVKELDGTLFIEQRVAFDDWVPEGYGTADAVILGATTLDIQDLKMGKGVKVFAQDNPQPILYGLGVLQEFEFAGIIDDIEIVRLTIIQPLLDHVDIAEYTVEELRAEGAKLSEAAKLALEPGAPRVPGDKQCTFCKASGNCKAEADYHLQTACGEFAQWEQGVAETLTDPQDLDYDTTRAILDNMAAFKKWLDKVKDRAVLKITSGEGFDGYKMVAGNSKREWQDADAAERALKRALGAANAFKKTLLTPPAAEKELGKGHHILEKYVVKSAGAPTLVSEKDKRPAIDYSPVDPDEDFADIDAEDDDAFSID